MSDSVVGIEGLSIWGAKQVRYHGPYKHCSAPGKQPSHTRRDWCASWWYKYVIVYAKFVVPASPTWAEVGTHNRIGYPGVRTVL